LLKPGYEHLASAKNVIKDNYLRHLIRSYITNQQNE